MNKFVLVALETTGHSPLKNDQIIEVGIVVIENNEITDTRTTLFNPKIPIPSFISNLTGISDRDVEDAPLFNEKADKIVDIFKFKLCCIITYLNEFCSYRSVAVFNLQGTCVRCSVGEK